MLKANDDIKCTPNVQERTTLNLSVTVEDKTFLKVYAAEHGVTVAAVIHDCITEYLVKKQRAKKE